MDDFPLEYRFVTDEDRSKTLKSVVLELSRQPIDAAIVVTPEGYGKSFLLVLHLLSEGYKVVFCTKSNAQILAKENDITQEWAPKIKATLGRMPWVERYESKIQHLQSALETVGIEPNEFRVVSYKTNSPYAPTLVNDIATVKKLSKLFAEKGIPIDAETFYGEHYHSHQAPDINGRSADVILISFAAFQAFCQSKKEFWWVKLGLIAATDRKWIEKGGKEKLTDVHYPFERVAVIIDDPDKDDLDWLRRVSDKNAELLSQSRAVIPDRRIAMESPAYWRRCSPEAAKAKAALAFAYNETIRNTPIHRIVKIDNAYYEERPDTTTLGYRFKIGRLRPSMGKGSSAPKSRAFCPKMIVTTTEMLTAHYAQHTLEHIGLKVTPKIDVFRTFECDVTAIHTTIVRKANHAVLLPIVELLRKEFPEENLTLIGNGLNCEFNLSTNKGRNDLNERSTIIKLSWLHPNATATTMVHLKNLAESSISTDEIDIVAFSSKEGLFRKASATVLSDLGNQAIGRNQGFRYCNRQSIVLIDPDWYAFVTQRLRYKLNPWSTQLPSFNEKTSKKSAYEAIQMADGQSRLEKRLIELIFGFREFGLSDEATRLAEKLPENQQKHFSEWLEKQNDPDLLTKKADAKLRRQKKVNEAVRRCRERKKAAALS